jgi:hypothetical protein
MKVTRTERTERLRICQSCEHYTSSGTCGTPIVGDTLPDGSKLCGCFMAVKTWLRVGSCPIKKWRGHVSKEQIELLRAIASEVKNNSMQKSTQLKLVEWWRVNMNQSRSAGSCCAMDLWQDTQRVLSDSEL